MADVNIDHAAIRRLANDPNGPVGRDIRRRAQNAETAARRGAPVDTGRMRGATHVDGPHQGTRGIAYDVVAAVNYSFYVNSGTRYMRARPFLTNAVFAALR